MSLNEQKIEVTQAILNSNNVSMLRQVQAVIEAYNTDLRDELSDYQKQCVAEARKELKNGAGVTHAVAMRKYKKWLSK